MSRSVGVLVAVPLVLLAAGPAAAQPAEDRWALSSAACTGELLTRAEAPLILRPMTIRWFNSDCTVVSSYKVGQSLFLQGQCRSEGRTATIPIMLEPRGDRMRVGWNREPVVEMQRCLWTDALGYHWAAASGVIQGPKAGK